MEPRKITIVHTKSQKKTVILTSATTLAELRRDLRANNIDYSGMTFYEGLTKTELKDDTSVLPTNVPYKGTTTNELVFMLTNMDKKIQSGASSARAELCNKIKEFGLKDECMKRFGKNFTNCKTSDLEALVNEYSYFKTAEVKDTKTEEVVEGKTECKCENPCKSACTDGYVTKDVFNKLIDYLYENDILDYGQMEELKSSIGESPNPKKESMNSSYSNDEIDDMFNFIR